VSSLPQAVHDDLGNIAVALSEAAGNSKLNYIVRVTCGRFDPLIVQICWLVCLQERLTPWFWYCRPVTQRSASRGSTAMVAELGRIVEAGRLQGQGRLGVAGGALSAILRWHHP